MVDVRGDVLRPPHGTTPAVVKSNIKSEMRTHKSNENIHKKEGGSYYVVSAKPVRGRTGNVTIQKWKMENLLYQNQNHRANHTF